MLFEAQSGATSWKKSGLAGELNVLSLGGGVLALQLRDSLSGRLLFEHKLSKVDEYSFKSERFHTVCLDKGRHRGFAFGEEGAAKEFKQQLLRVLPLLLPLSDPSSGCSHTSDESFQSVASSACSSCRTPGKTYDCTGDPSHSVESHSSSNWRRVCITPPPPENSLFAAAGAAVVTKTASLPPSDRTPPSVSPTATSKSRKMSLRDMLRECLCIDSNEEPEFEIGEPFDVKHVGHIGWDTPSFGGNGWLDDLMEAPSFSDCQPSECGEAQARREPDFRQSRDFESIEAHTTACRQSNIAEAQAPARPERNHLRDQSPGPSGRSGPARSPSPEYRDDSPPKTAASEPQAKINNSPSFMRKFF